MMTSAKNHKLQALFPSDRLGDSGDTVITGLSMDTRTLQLGDLFVAVHSNPSEAQRMCHEAIKAGAAAVVVGESVILDGTTSVPIIAVPNARATLSRVAKHWFPAEGVTVGAVTGTNGKSSVAHFTMQLMAMEGGGSASIGTLGTYIREGSSERLERHSTLTTPDSITLHSTLHQLAAEGITHVAVEASSHGLDQYRLDGLAPFAAVGFTNLTRDHLDYHGSMEAYFNAKMRLFTDLIDSHSTAIINGDIPEAPILQKASEKQGAETVFYGRMRGHSAAPWLHLQGMVQSFAGQALELEWRGTVHQVTIPLIGEFQAYNIMCALGMAAAMTGKDIAHFIPFTPRLHSVPGRMQLVAPDNDQLRVIVDYAHTPDGLEQALRMLRPLTTKRLIVVFGCGGDRDRGKRPLMGEVAARYADIIIVTDDNPRTESPAAIRQEVMAGCPKAMEIDGREAAIALALSQASPGDIILIAGKGHEKTQTIGTEVIPFDDVSVAAQYMRRK